MNLCYSDIFFFVFFDYDLNKFHCISFILEDNVYRILYEEVDESEVKIFNFPSSNSAGSGEIEQYRYNDFIIL